jgi:PIN domain nuclease of toxin-antitoxin system
MKLLLDTHAFIWLDIDPDRLSRRVREVIVEPAVEVYLSIASVWEMQIKLSTRKLRFNRPLPEIITAHHERNRVSILGLKLDHVWALERLPTHHGDPFDRLLVAQAMHEQLALVTKDRRVSEYPVHRFW